MFNSLFHNNTYYLFLGIKKKQELNLIEIAGSFDLDAELKIWLSGMLQPIQKQFNKSLNIYELQNVLASYILK